MLATGCSGQERAAPSIEPSQMVNSQKMDDIYDVPSSENDITTEGLSAVKEGDTVV